MAFLGGLALLGAGDPATAYQTAKGRKQALDAADVEQQASAALGQGMGALAQLQQMSAGGGGPPGGGQPPPGMPAGGAMPQQRPPVQFGPPGGGGGGQPPAPMGGPPGGAGGGMAPQMGPQGGGMPPPGMPPGGGGGQPQGQPNMTPGMMDLPTLAAVIQRANPGIKPEVFAHALQQGAKLLSPFAQNQLREMMMHLAQQRVEQGGERVQQGWERIQQGEEKIQQGQQRVDTQGKALQERTREFDIREARFNAQNEIKNNVQLQKLEIERKRLESTLSKDTLAQYRAIIDAQHKIVSEQIQAAAAGLGPDDRKKLLGEEDKRYQDEIKGMRDLLGSSTPTGGTSKTPQPKTQDRAPAGGATFGDRFGGSGEGAGVPVPKEHAGDPEGTRYEGSNGQMYVKQGDRMVPAGQ